MNNYNWIHRLSTCFSLPHIENDDISPINPKKHSETDSLQIVEEDFKTMRQMVGGRTMEIINGITSINFCKANKR